MSKLFPLFIILVASFLVRIIGTGFPPSPNWDEVSIGYNAYSLLVSGRDEWGVVLPTLFRAYGDYKLPVYIYSAAPFIQAFGLTELAIRLTSIISGVLLVACIYLISKHLFKSEALSLLAAITISFSHWSLFLSRIALEANLGIALLTLGLLSWLKNRLSIGLLFLGLSAWTYNSIRGFVAIVSIIMSLYFLARRKSILPKTVSKRSLIAFCVGFVMILASIIQMFSQSGQARLNWLSIIDSGAIAKIESLRNSSRLPGPLISLVYNRPTYFSLEFARNYVSHFLPGFLFVHGGSHYQFNIPGVSLMPFVSLPFFYIGLLYLLIKPKKYWFVLFWLLISPVAGSITRDSPHTLRAITLFPVAALVICLGIRVAINFKKKWSIALLSTYIFFYMLSGYSNFFTKIEDYTRNYSWSWQYGYKEVVAEVMSRDQEFDQFIITKAYGEPHEFFLFYSRQNPSRYHDDPNLVRYWKSNWYWVDSYSKYRFVNDWEMADVTESLSAGKRYMIIGAPSSKINLSSYKIINFLDGKPAFLLYDLNVHDGSRI